MPLDGAAESLDAGEAGLREAALLQAARGGDRAAFGLLVRGTAPTLERLALRLVGHREDAEDVAQDAVLSAWRGLRSFRGGARFSTWLYRIVVTRALDCLRRRRPAASAPLEAAADPRAGPAEGAARADVERAIRAAIDTLPPVQRATLLLRTDQELSYEQIAYVLGTTRNAVRNNLIDARRNLAARLRGVVDLGEGGRR